MHGSIRPSANIVFSSYQPLHVLYNLHNLLLTSPAVDTILDSHRLLDVVMGSDGCMLGLQLPPPQGLSIYDKYVSVCMYVCM